MTVIPDSDRMWPDALVDLGPIELADSYWAMVGTIPYEGHVILAILSRPVTPRGSR
jgi:hypothetical protein